jgi:signal peptidase II
LGIAADLWTKFAVFEWLSDLPGEKYTLIEGWFDFVMVYNPGAAFGILVGKQVFLVSISVIAMFVVLGIFLFGKIDKKIMVVILGLFMAGIVGNLYDRAVTGPVRDFIDVHYREVYHWPAFNIADSMLCTAVGLMIILQIRAAILEKRSHRQK